MIKLEIEDYCNDCPYFSSDEKTIYANDSVYTAIQCKDRDKCLRIANHILSRVQNKPQNER